MDLRRSPEAMAAFARRLGAALSQERLGELADLSAREPLGLFASRGQEGEGAPIDELALKDSYFAFDAGAAWAGAAGASLASAKLQDELQSWAGEALGLDAKRRPALAFVCAVMQAPGSPKIFEDFVAQLGAKIRWELRDFDGPEVAMWGALWRAQAEESGHLSRLSSRAAIQSLRRRWQQAPKEAGELWGFALSVGEPDPGWLARAWQVARQEIDEERRLQEAGLSRRFGLAQGRAMAADRAQKASERWQAMAALQCASAPAAWAQSALGDLGAARYPDLAIELDSKAIAKAAKPSEKLSREARL